MGIEKQGIRPTDFIKQFLDSGLKDLKEERTLSGELIKLKIKKEHIKSGQIKLVTKVVGKISGETLVEYNLEFESIIYPFYYLELIKLAIEVYWAGNKMNKKLQKRIIYMNEYGEAHKEYFNRSFKYLYYLKQPTRIFKK